jgi:hypothetical protein
MEVFKMVHDHNMTCTKLLFLQETYPYHYIYHHLLNRTGLFGTRTVVEEDFFFDLARQNVDVYDFSGEDVYPPQEVVDRAREKIGSILFLVYSLNLQSGL